MHPGTDNELFAFQAAFMSTVLDKVLLNSYRMRLVQKYKENLRTLWDDHETDQTSSSSSHRIAVLLSGKLANMKISDFKSRTAFLEEFNTVLQKFDQVQADKMPPSQKISLLKKVANADNQLLQAWTAVETIISHGSALCTVTTYEKYLEYLVSHSEKLEESSIDNYGQRVN